jgi:type VI secretion system protein ImpA
MATPEVLDFSTLLNPIAGENPAGEDLRSNSSPTSPYYGVKDARSTARTTERQLIMGGEAVSPPDWRLVVQRATKAIAEKSKDLEIAAYLTEALVRLNGFAGLRDGFRLMRELIEQFWDSMYPAIDEDGVETRVAPLVGLNGDDAEGTLIYPISNIPITAGNNFGPYAYSHYQQGHNLSGLNEEAKEKRLAQGAISIEMFEKAGNETSTAFFQQTIDDVEQCQHEFTQLSDVLYNKCEEKTPPTSQIRQILESCLEAVRFASRNKLMPQVSNTEDENSSRVAEDGTVAVMGSRSVGFSAADALQTREEAFRTLLKVAEYFRISEPHTPVSYALEQAVRWGRMSLPELLNELIPDSSSREHFFKLSGIRENSDN